MSNINFQKAFNMSVLEKAFKCMQLTKNDHFTSYTVVAFSYDQLFVPVGNPR